MRIVTRPWLTRASRGQAIFETALFMPLFLLGFFGVVFAVGYASLSERVQFGVRYGGAVANLSSPYQSYSLFSMYDAADGGKSSDPSNCGGATPDPTQVTTSTRGAIWRGMSTTQTCAGGIGSVNFTSDQPMLLENSYMQMTTQTPLSAFMKDNVFGGSTSKMTSAAGNFFRSPDVGSLVNCSTLEAPVKSTLEGEKDAASTSAPATAIPVTIATASVITAPMACATGVVPFDELADVTAPPLFKATAPPTTTPTCPPGDTGSYPACVSPPPPPTCPPKEVGTYPACTAPTASPIPTMSPKPTPTPKPTVAPTACPAGDTTLGPGNCVKPATAAPATPPPVATSKPTTPPATSKPTTPPATAPPTMTPVTPGTDLRAAADAQHALLSATTPILVVSILYGAASFAAAYFATADESASAGSSDRFPREMLRLILVLLAAATGAMIESRQFSDPASGITPLEVFMGAAIMAGFAAAVIGGLRRSEAASSAAFYVGVAPIVIVVFVAVVEGQWFGLGAGLLCALPFAIAGYFFPRPSSTDDAMYAGLAGAALSLFPAMAVLFAGCLVSLGVARVRQIPSNAIRFSPYVAGFAMLGLLVRITLQP